jgi:hypothetical protein
VASIALLERAMQNYDAAFKDSFTLFKNKSLQFLGIESDARITEVLATEKREVHVDTEFSDLNFLTDDGFGLHIEEEVDISRKDLYRFCGYHVDLTQLHGRDFHTVILTFKRPRVREIVTPTLVFKPMIVDLSERDAGEVFERLRRQIEGGEEINELDLVFLPVCRSETETVVELLDKGVELALELPAGEKIAGLMLMLSNQLVEKTELKRIREKLMNYSKLKIVQVMEELGEERGIEKGRAEGVEKGKLDTARNFKLMGLPLEQIAAGTGLPIDMIAAL